MLIGVLIALRRARRRSAVHSATSVRHRWRLATLPAAGSSKATRSLAQIFPKRRSDWVALSETALNFPPGPNHGRPATLVSSTLSIGHKGEKGSFPLCVV